VRIVCLLPTWTVNRDKGLDQLKLALAWNRIDVAREEIFTDDVTFHVRLH